MRVEFKNLTKSFGKKHAVNNFSATLPDGELVSLLGPSGCGKSTILNMLAGILPVSGGQILFDGEDVTNLPPEERGIGLVFQNYALYPHMTVLKNICFPLEIQGVPKQERIARATEMAKLVHVDTMLDRKPKAMSGGQQQRVAIARALVKRPRLLLLDEPLCNLDARLRLEMREEIRRIQQETKVTTIFVTHDQEEAMSISDHIVLMKDGVLQQFDEPQRLYDEPCNSFVAYFLGNPPINRIMGEFKNGVFTPDGSSEGIKLDRFAGEQYSGRAELAVRCESFSYEKTDFGAVSCEVVSVYKLGKDEMAQLRIGSATVRAFIPSDYGMKAGTTQQLYLKKRGVFLFRDDNGERLGESNS